MSVGFKPNGKRDRRVASAKTKAGARAKLREMLPDLDDGVPIASRGYTVREAVEDWIRFGLSGRDPETVKTRTILANKQVIPALDRRKLRELTADDVDEWLESMAQDAPGSTHYQHAAAERQARLRVEQIPALRPQHRSGDEYE